jgi:hypothetical protein
MEGRPFPFLGGCRARTLRSAARLLVVSTHHSRHIQKHLWRRSSTRDSAAVQNLLDGDEMVRRSRKQEIVADVAYAILTRDSRSCTGNFFIDEDVLREECITDVASYQLAESEEALEIDIFLNA